MPADVGRVVRILGPDREMEQPNIRADQILNGVKDCWMVDDLVYPCEQKMRLEVMALGELGTLRRFEILHGFAIMPHLLGAKGVDRINESVAVILVDLRVGQLPAHVTILYRNPAAVGEQQDAGAAPEWRRNLLRCMSLLLARTYRLLILRQVHVERRHISHGEK